MMMTNEWERWTESWRATRATPAELDALIARTRRARRAMALMRILSVALAVLALSAVGLALRHAGNRFEAVLGILVGLAIAVAWFADAITEGDASDIAESLPQQYRDARRALCRRQLRLARLGFVVVALELSFLAPWWAGGIAVHGLGFQLMRILTFWGPLTAMLGFVWWTFRVRARASAELRQLDSAEASPLEE